MLFAEKQLPMSARVEVVAPAGDREPLVVRFSGPWARAGVLPAASSLHDALRSGPAGRGVKFDTRELVNWDTGFLTFLHTLFDEFSTKGVPVDPSGLPEGARRLLALASAVPERAGARRTTTRQSWLTRLGNGTLAGVETGKQMLAFLGEACVALVALARGRARFRSRDLWLVVQEVGADALPIVSLISLLVGLILAFVAAVQLLMFGAQIYVASLVGIAMIRVMGAIMTGIIMAGRTGAAFAARLGTMQVNEEIDALRTLGISPMEFLVLPRLIALVLMMPLLCLYADIMGVLGGLLVGVGMLDLSVTQYLQQTWVSVRPQDLWIGLLHGTVFGVLVALTGCMYGMRCGRSASAVGDATTSAVVAGIVSIITATALITVVCNVLGV